MFRKRVVLLLAIAAGFMSACSSPNIGGIYNSREVAVQIEQFDVQPNYRYWYLNQENNPFGIVGLDRDYRLDADPMWQAVAPDSEIFRKVVALIQSFPVPGSYVSGFAITDSQGRPIGLWYSSLSAGITVDPQTKVVSIATMMPWVFSDEF